MKKRNPPVEVMIREGAEVHAGLKQVQKIIAKQSADFQFVRAVTLYLDGETSRDQEEIVRTIHSLMQNLHLKIGKEIQENNEHQDGYYISNHIQYLNEIQTVHNWLRPIGEYWTFDLIPPGKEASKK